MVASSPGGPAIWNPSCMVGDGIIEGWEDDAGIGVAVGAVIVVGGAVAVAIFGAVNTDVTGPIRGRCWESGTNSSDGSWHYQGMSVQICEDRL